MHEHEMRSYPVDEGSHRTPLRLNKLLMMPYDVHTTNGRAQFVTITLSGVREA